MSITEYTVLRSKFTPDSPVYERMREAFFEEHPDCPRPKPIECLNLIMRREYAEEILAGTKKVEIRSYSQHYADRLYDKDVLAYEDKYWDDELMRMQIFDFTDSVRAVKKIHFHNYNNSWFLDVECIDNNTVIVNDEQVRYLQEEYDCHEFDDELKELNKCNADVRPMFFYFAVGRILSTNLR